MHAGSPQSLRGKPLNGQVGKWLETHTETFAVFLSNASPALQLRLPSPTMQSNEEYTINQPPEDGITRVRFSPTENWLIASSWDTTVRMYDVLGNTIKAKYSHKAAVLDCCFADTNHIFSGGLDKSVAMFDVLSERQMELGEHGESVRTVNWSAEYGVLVSGGWDGMLKVWDPRQASNALVGSYQQPERVYAADVSGLRVIVGTAARHVWIWDLRKMNEPEQRRMASLKFQTRCIRAFPDGTGYALSSTEGRVSMEFFDTSKEEQMKKYIFKCHRGVIDNVDYAYPVNAIAFRPGSTQFATGGGDCSVPMWDTAAKKRLFLLPKYPTSISSLDFSHNGQYLAVASSYTFEELDKPHPPDAIYIRSMV